MWVEPTTWRLDAPERTDYPSCATSTLPQAGRTLGTWCRWVCDWVSPCCLHPEPQPVSVYKHVHYCVFVTKPLNREERWPEGHIGTSWRAGCQRPVARSSARVMKVRDRLDRVLVVLLFHQKIELIRPCIRPRPSVCCANISLVTDIRTSTPTVWLTRETLDVST